MRPDTSFSDKKLTRAEFSKKYWLDGDVPYQYHTAEIEDGRNEREQFFINNDRALFNFFRKNQEEIREKHELAEQKSEKKCNEIEKKCNKMFLIAIFLELALTIFQLSRKN